MDWRPNLGAQVAVLLPFAKAPEVADLLQLIDANWFGCSKEAQSSTSSEVVSASPRRRQQHAASGASSSLSSSCSASSVADTAQLPQRSLRESGRGARALHLPEQPEELPWQPDGLGTWGMRQQVFLSRPLAASTRADGSVEPATATAEAVELPVSASPTLHFAGESVSPTPPADVTSSEATERHEAWRWRFSRKWQSEQVRQQMATTPSKDEDDWNTALDYMAAAAAGGVNMQFERRDSNDISASLEPSLSQSLLLESSMSINERSGLWHAANLTTPNATREIFSAVRKAEELMHHQQEIEKKVDAKWQSTEAQQPWVGHHVAAAAIDLRGSFEFALALIVDRGSRRQKLLLRGRNGVEAGKVFKGLEQEVMRVAVEQGMPTPRVELLGSGLMQWSWQQLNVTAHKLRSTSATLQNEGDLARMVATLAQTGLPLSVAVKNLSEPV